MRDALRRACRIGGDGVPQHVPDHCGLAYGPWAPTSEDGKVPDSARSGWLGKLSGLGVSPDYKRAFETWKSSLRPPRDQILEFTLASRLLIGHGNSSATEVGLTVHHTWGVPVIPGAALKGLCAHYTAAMYGPDDHGHDPWTLTGQAAERARYQGVRWDEKSKNRIKVGPGDVYRVLFGAPDADDDESLRREAKKQGKELWPAGAARGGVAFHDALYDPESNDEHGKKITSPFVEDVLTVHQKKYYDSTGKHASGQPEPWPNDYDDPVPVAFLTVRPRARFLLALSGLGIEAEAAEQAALAAYILGQALQEWGVGGKTSLGYGHGTVGVWEGSEQ